jgi:hypothetical protein
MQGAKRSSNVAVAGKLGMALVFEANYVGVMSANNPDFQYLQDIKQGPGLPGVDHSPRPRLSCRANR